MAKAVMKKKASTRSGLLRTNSIHRSLTFTLADSFWSMTTFSLHWEKQKNSKARPTRAKMVIVMNQAGAASGVLYTATPSTLGAKIAMISGSDFTHRAPRLAMNMRVLVRMVISLVSRVSEAFRAP